MKKYLKIICFGVFVASLLAIVYLPALNNGFTGDDKYIYIANDFIKDWGNVPRLFQRNYLSSLDNLVFLGRGDIGSGEMTYRPVCTLSYFFDYSVWKSNLFGPHLTNVLLHFLSAFLVYLLSLRIHLTRPAAIFAALVFVLHPVNNEVVAVITSRDDMLAFVFLACAILFYQNFRNSAHKKWGYYFVSLVMYFFAIFTKGVAAGLPIIIALYDYCFLSEKTRKFSDLLKLYSGYVVILLFYLFVYLYVMSPVRAGVLNYFAGDWISVGATVIRITALYLSWVIVPLNIPATIADSEIIVKDFLNVQFVLSLLGVVAAGTCIFLAFKRQRRRFLFAFFWSLVTVLPVLIVLPWMFNVLYAARFLYIPMAGFCFVLGMIWDAAAKNSKRPVILYCFSIGLLVFCAFVTVNKLPVWKDDLTLSLDRLKYYPRSTLAFLNAGAAFEERGMLKEAGLLYEHAVELDPGCPECQNQLGLFQLKSGGLEKAVTCFRQAVSLDHDYEFAENNLCSTLGRQKNYREAEACFSGFLAKHPRSVKGYYNFGILYLEQGKMGDAVKVWDAGLIIEPNNLELKEVVAKFGAHQPGLESKP